MGAPGGAWRRVGACRGGAVVGGVARRGEEGRRDRGACGAAAPLTPPRRRPHPTRSPRTGVPGVEAEAELLAAITTFFARVGLSAKDVGLKVSSRKVLQAVMARYGVPPESFAQARAVVCLSARPPARATPPTARFNSPHLSFPRFPPPSLPTQLFPPPLLPLKPFKTLKP